MTSAADALADATLSRDVACEAGALILEVRASFGEIDPDDHDRLQLLRTTADREAHLLIAARLGQARPDDALLSEEGDDDFTRLSADRVWIVDPLDGTWEFGQGRPDFAVHVALWLRTSEPGGSLAAATVDLPDQGDTWSVLDDVPVPAPLPIDRPVRVVVSRSRQPIGLDGFMDRLAAELGESAPLGVVAVRVGSVGAKAAELFGGRAEVYTHDGGFSEWDLAAPLAVALKRGIACWSPGGPGCEFNRRDVVQPGVVMAVPAVAAAARVAFNR